MDPLSDLMRELSPLLNMDLAPDDNESVLLKFEGKYRVQMQQEQMSGHLLIVSQIADLPAGRYREELLRGALQDNGGPHPRMGTFAYSQHTNSLVYHSQIPMEALSGDKLYSFLLAFLDVVKQWHGAIERGEPPPSGGILPSSAPSPFGL